MDADPIKTVGRDRLARIDLNVYGLEAVLKSAYRFTGKCFIHLQHAAENGVEIRLRPKLADEDPDAAIREFFNDLLDQRLRSIVAAETAEVRNLVMAHALSQTSFIRPALETAEPTEDPENVSLPDRRSASAS